MTITLEKLLSDIQSRQPHPGFGIATAKRYVAEIAPCVEGGDGDLCPVKAFGIPSGNLWAKELAESNGRLTYHDSSMGLDTELVSKSLHDGSSLPDHTCLTFDCVLTTKEKDRDGDIIEPSGLLIDKHLPLLWQHIQLQPIGKMVDLLEQSDDRIRVKFGIGDTALGRDTATLVKMGALRMSQGFLPSEFAPLEIIKGAGPDGRDLIKGWHVKKGRCLEGSTVSIPANAGAVITAYSQKSLRTDLMNHWAKQFYDSRPVQVPGVTLKAGDGGTTKLEIEVSVKGGGMAPASPQAGDGKDEKDGKDGSGDGKGKKKKGDKENASGSKENAKDSEKESKEYKIFGDLITKAGKVISAVNMAKLKAAVAELEAVIATAEGDSDSAKSFAEQITTKAIDSINSLQTKMMGVGDDYLEGSWEWIERKLERTAGDYLRSRGIDVDRHNSYVRAVATFADRGIVCVHHFGSDNDKCYQMNWETGGDDNEPRWTGEPAEVEIKPQVLEKMIQQAELTRKAGDANELAKVLRQKCLQDGNAAPLAIISESLQFINEQRAEKEFSELFGGL